VVSAKALYSPNEPARGIIIDDNEFEALYAAHIRQIFNFCNYQLQDQELAEDITHDVFQRAWERRDMFDPRRASFITWIFRIAQNMVIDQHRKPAISRPADLDPNLPDSRQPNPEQEVENLERSEQLRNLMQGLNKEQRLIISLRFGVGLSYDAIGKILGKKPSALSSSVNRALNKMRKAMPKEEKSYE
jgi:RNA polymerase sigma-70 factor, ECF subfamily